MSDERKRKIVEVKHGGCSEPTKKDSASTEEKKTEKKSGGKK